MVKKVRRKKKEVDFKQEHIVEAAEQVFFAKGIRNTTMDDIAKAAEYTKRSLYVYFKTKEEIYYIIIRRAYLLLRDMMLEGLEPLKKATGLEKVQAIGHAFIDFTREYPDHYKVIVMYQSLKIDGDSSDKEEYLAEGEDIFEFLVFIVREGIQDKSLRQDIDAVATAYMLYAHIIGMGMLIRNNELNFFQRFPRRSSELVEEMFTYALRSIAAK